MRAAAIRPATPPVLDSSQRDALISLLVDEDREIYRVVRGKLLAYGGLVVHWLRPHTLSDDPVMRRRAREIIEHLGRKEHDQRLMKMCRSRGGELDLEQATFLLAQTRYPSISVEGYRALYDQWAEDLRAQFAFGRKGAALLGRFNDYFFDELKFTGCEDYAYDPECCYLNRVIDRRTGNPINLCTIYLLLAKRLELPITGVSLGDYFVCRYQSPTEEIYIDVFRKGLFLTKADCVRHLQRNKPGKQGLTLAPMSPRNMFMRMCGNLHRTCAHLELTEDALRAQRYLFALARQG